jgi:hypothetical protein
VSGVFLQLAQSEFEKAVFSEDWQVRLAADGEAYQAEKKQRLISAETSAKLQELMAEHGRKHGSAAAAAGRTNVRGSERVMQAHQQSKL